MKEKLKVNGEPAQGPGDSPVAMRLVENVLVRNPLVALAGHLAGLLLRLLPRRKPTSPAQSLRTRRSRCSRSRLEAHWKHTGSTPVKAVAKATAFAGLVKGGYRHG